MLFNTLPSFMKKKHIFITIGELFDSDLTEESSAFFNV